MERRILVTGGTGMIGRALQSVLPDAIYAGSARGDLRDPKQTDELFRKERPTHVIHLAAKVGGVKANSEYMADFFHDNLLMSTNVLHTAHKHDVEKVVSLLSTCVYPNVVSYPITEDQLHNGPPHSSNFGYAQAKRMIDVQSRAYRQQYARNFVTAIPNNLYGPHDNFDLENSHVVPAMIRKFWEAKRANEDVVLWGDGSPLREFSYSKDLAEILVFLLNHYDGETPINIGNTEEHSIKHVAETIADILGFKGRIVWDATRPTGQFKKPSSNQRLLDLGWNSRYYTPLHKGLTKMCKWFITNYPNVRGVNE